VNGVSMLRPVSEAEPKLQPAEQTHDLLAWLDDREASGTSGHARRGRQAPVDEDAETTKRAVADEVHGTPT
jgi:hypothetical protein